MAGVAQQHHGFEVLAREQVVAHHALPAQLGLARDGRVAVPGQVGQDGIGHTLFAQGEQVDALGPTRRLGGKGEPFLLRQRVDAGGFAGIGPPDKRHFRHRQVGQKFQLRCGGEEARGVQPAVQSTDLGHVRGLVGRGGSVGLGLSGRRSCGFFGGGHGGVPVGHCKIVWLLV